MGMAFRLITGVALALIATAAAAAERPQVIARGGTSITFPADTAAAFDLAIAERADALWIDVAATSDEVLITRPARNLARSTNAAATIGPLQLPKDAPPVIGYPVDWIPYAGYARLAARHEDTSRDPRFNDMFSAPLLADVLALVKARRQTNGQPIPLIINLIDAGVYAKDPIEPKVIALLNHNHLDRAMIATGDLASLRRLRAASRLPLILVYGQPDMPVAGDTQPGRTWASLEMPQGLAEVARLADAIAVNRDDLIGLDDSGNPLPPTAVAGDAKAAGLGLYALGFAAPDQLPLSRDQAIADYQAFLPLKIDGVVTDAPARALEAYP